MRTSIATHTHCAVSGIGYGLENNPSHSIIASPIESSRVNSRRSHRLHCTVRQRITCKTDQQTYKPYICGSTPADCIASCNTGSTDFKSVPCILLHVWMIGETYGFKSTGPRDTEDGEVGSRHSYQCEMLRINEQNSAQESAATHDREHSSVNRGSGTDESDSATESRSIGQRHHICFSLE